MASGPAPIGIEGLNATPFYDFRGGRVTCDNLSEMRKEELLLANNIVILADRMPSLRPGYNLIDGSNSSQPKFLQSLTAAGFAGPVIALFDYQRSVDQKQFIIVQLGPSAGQPNGFLLALDPTNGYKPFNVINANSGTFGGGKASFAIITPFELLVVTPNGSLVLLDVGNGLLTAVPAGITAPPKQPAVNGVAGNAFTLVYGWTYSYCWVRQWTDASGAIRYHIGPPTISQPNTAFLPNPSSRFRKQPQPPQVSFVNFVGPGSYSGITIQGPPSPNPNWNRIWIFRTNDTPLGTTSALFFVADIPAPVVFPSGPGWNFFDAPPAGFITVDDALDDTKPAPYDNFPPPGGSMVGELHSRALIAGIPGSPDLIQMSGDEEILLGVPQEAWPQDLFFDIPAGRKAASCLANFNETEFISSPDFWFTLKGYDVSTFQLRDKACEPGAVGPKAFCVTHTHLVYLGEDKNLWAWDGVSSRPVQFSKNLSKQLQGTLSMEDISGATLASAELQWLHFGRFNMILVMVATACAPPGQFDWIQLWDASFLGETYDDDVTPVGLLETDFFPSDFFSCSGQMLAGFVRFILFGDVNGNVYRWPDGMQDNGKNFQGALCTAWSSLKVFIGPLFHPIDPGEVVKRLFWGDIHSNRQDTAQSFHLVAAVADSPDMSVAPADVPLGPLLASSGNRGPIASAARGRFYDVPKLSLGRWGRFFVVFPDDGCGGTLVRLAVSAKPLFGLAP